MKDLTDLVLGARYKIRTPDKISSYILVSCRAKQVVVFACCLRVFLMEYVAKTFAWAVMFL